MLDLFSTGAIQPAQLTEARIWLEAVVVREACRRATPDDIAELRRNVEETAAAMAVDDFPLGAEEHRVPPHPGAHDGQPHHGGAGERGLDVLREFIRSIGVYPNHHVLPSRRRFIAHLAAGEADAAVAEMEASFKRLQRSYLSRLKQKA